jgi:DNA modification methylase
MVLSYMLLKADARRIPIAENSVHCCVTSPPYWGLRDYGVDGQLGLEKTPDEFVDNMVEVFREVRRILRPEGTLWLNMGDCYAAHSRAGDAKYEAKRNGGTLSSKRAAARPGINLEPGWRASGIKFKDLIGVPWMLAMALRADGWYLRQEIIWDKPNAMPESVRDRPSRAHEQVFLLTKGPRYYWDEVAERQPQKTLGKRHEGKSGYRDGHPSKGGIKARALNPLGGALRSVWRISSSPFKGAHFATMPSRLAARCIRLGSSSKGCCPDCGAPWRQVIERDRVATRPGTNSKVNRASCHDDSPYHGHSGSVIGNRDPQRHQTTVRVAGWESSCTCLEREPVPCTVFDPFGGAMTTLVAADALGRHGIATELSDEYLKLGAERLSRPHAPAKKPASAPSKPMPLFDTEDR